MELGLPGVVVRVQGEVLVEEVEVVAEWEATNLVPVPEGIVFAPVVGRGYPIR